MCFASELDDYGQIFVIDKKIKSKKKREYGFTTYFTYSQFEAIFIRTCIAFIENYVKEQQEGTPNAKT